MKDLFPGHFKEDEDQIKELWQSCIFAFDTNVLLNLYRYSDSSRDEFLQILEKLKNRVWLPHRAAEEYLNNRLSVIDSQEQSYDKTINSINSLHKGLINSRQHPFVSKNTMRKVDRIFSMLKYELEENKKTHTKRIHDDKIKDSISEIFSGRVGSPYNTDKLGELIKEGEERYKNKIPPGYMDSGKSDKSNSKANQYKMFGDLIVWKQVIDKSKQEKRAIILITDDKKEDWWINFKGKTIGPRPELIEEFKANTEHSFHMYQTDRFIEYSSGFLNEKLNQDLVNEIREVRRLDSIEIEESNESFDINNVISILDQNIRQLGLLKDRKNMLIATREMEERLYNGIISSDPNSCIDHQYKSVSIDNLNKKIHDNEIKINNKNFEVKELKELVENLKTSK
ncbi:DUF4935 domain-containing protein [Vibrio sp. SCSIO 43132]|uniref:PIN-like domain-containing protein n=1 Tax=Vibrio sp. SCSIO 43132 TaxID=2779363 RepID=UPI001CA83615|nr:PIN domain-containing protein [Vibrio sp. SCSIO 43132]UAB68829.1 DUF4935 domain-containing protein [Vibrio sp. SCSIO 43132]